MDEDPLAFLQNYSREDIMTFLKWLHDNYRIKKLDSSHEYKRIFLMLYRRCIGHSIRRGIVVAT
jgi:ABC-type molybdate transport system ATPase subunit